MESKNCNMCHVENHINIFHKKCSEGKSCNSKKGINNILRLKMKSQIEQRYFMK